MSKDVASLKLHVDQHGILREPRLHDAEIVSLALEKFHERKRLRAILVTESGSPFEVVFHDVALLRASEFGTQNVIFEIEYFCGSDPLEKLQEIKAHLYKNSDSDLEKLATEIRAGRMTLVLITPSVGCEVLCLCRSLEITPGGIGPKPISGARELVAHNEGQVRLRTTTRSTRTSKTSSRNRKPARKK